MRIVEVEGPVIVHRLFSVYLRFCGIKRMGHELASTLNSTLARKVQQGRLVCEYEGGLQGLLGVVRIEGQPPVRLRKRGLRLFEEIPPSEIQLLAALLVDRCGFKPGSEGHVRAILDCFDRKNLTAKTVHTIEKILEGRLPYVDEAIDRFPG